MARIEPEDFAKLVDNKRETRNKINERSQTKTLLRWTRHFALML